MSSITDPQSDLPSEELVAYLDGELSPEDSRRVEERLAQDADYRQKLRDLDQAWEVLDALPAATVDDNFARTTIEMVTVAAEQDISQCTAQTAATNRNRLRLWAISGLTAAVASFAIIHALIPNQNDRLLADLPVIRQFDHLSQIENVDFLRKLPAVVALEQLAHDQLAVKSELADVTAAAAPSLAERSQWVEGLPPDQKASLASQAKRFADFAERSAEEERRLREMEREIGQDKNTAQLRKTMVIYSRWLAQRAPGEQEDLRVLSVEERLKAIAGIVRREGEEAARHLSAKDAAELREEIFEIYDERKLDFERAMRRKDHDNRARLEGSRRRRALIILTWELRNDERDDRTRDRLIEQLSPEAQQYWERISRRGRDRRQHQLWQWVREAMQPSWGPGELERFFTNDLDTNERERLLSLPPDMMQAQLERLYLAGELGLHGNEEWLNEFGAGGRFQRNRPQPDRPADRRPDGPRGDREEDRTNEGRPPGRPLQPDGPPPAKDEDSKLAD